MKGCELCDRAAGLYCESDQASLCWECDAKVHGANFLVARHGRLLLCRSCQAPTPWRAEGARVSAAISVCQRCTTGGKAAQAAEEEESDGEAEGGGEMMEEDEEDGFDDYESDVGEEDEEEGGNQVVPGALSPPPLESSSSDEGSSSPEKAGFAFFQRMEENAGLASQNDLSCSHSHWNPTLTMPPPPAAAAAAGESFSARSGSLHHPYNLGRSGVHHAAPSSVSGDGAGAGSHFISSGDHSTVCPVSSAFRSPLI